MVDVKYDYCCRNIRGVVGVGRAGWDVVRCGGGGGGRRPSSKKTVFLFSFNGQCHIQYDTTKHIISFGGYSSKNNYCK